MRIVNLTEIAATADGEVPHVVGVGSDEGVWHGVLDKQGQMNWTSCESAGTPTAISAISCAWLTDGLHVVCLDAAGQPWHTSMGTDSTSPNGGWLARWESISAKSKGPTSFSTISCASPDQATLQVVVLGDTGEPFRTLRKKDGTWQPRFDEFETRMSPYGDGPAGGHLFADMTCTGGLNGGLVVVGVGTDGKIWSTYELNGDWNWTFVLEGVDPVRLERFKKVACGLVQGELSMVALGSDGKLYGSPPGLQGAWQVCPTALPQGVTELTAIAVAVVLLPGGGPGIHGHGKGDYGYLF